MEVVTDEWWASESLCQSRSQAHNHQVNGLYSVHFAEPPVPVLQVEVNGGLTSIPEPPAFARDPGIDMEVLVAAQNRYAVATAKIQDKQKAGKQLGTASRCNHFFRG